MVATRNNKKVEEILKKGGVGVMLTDTIYGLLGKALEEETVKRIYALKKRNPEKPCIILIQSIYDLELFGIQINEKEKEAVKELWSDSRPTSIVFKCTEEKFSYLHRNTNTLALRLPRSKSLLKLLSKTGPLIATSANPEGLSPAKSIDMAKDYFENSVDFYAGRNTTNETHSRLVSLNEDGSIKILRE